MPLNQAIEFQHLISQLTDLERIQFLSTLIHSHVDTVLSSLFQHLVNPNQINKVNEFNQSISAIIQSRKEKPKPLCMRNIKLQQFPRAIIGYTASFLNQYDYVDFSLSNRSVYLGCNSPNTLQTLSLDKPKDFSSLNVTSLPSITYLSVDLTTAIESQHMFRFDVPKFSQVTRLRLAANKSCGWVQKFFNLNLVSCDNVTTLDCWLFGSRNDQMTRNEWLSLLKRFHNLTHLKMNRVHVANDITAQDIADLCPKIVGLALNQMRNDLIQTFAKQLKYLACMQYQRNRLDLDDLAFGALEELLLFWPGKRVFDHVLKSALNLKKIMIVYRGDWMSKEENHIASLIIKLTSLNLLRIAVKPSEFSSVLENIERGLFEIQTKKQHKRQMKIHISFSGYKNDEVSESNLKANEFTFNVGRLVNSLEACGLDDFMLIWQLPDFVDGNESNDIRKDLCNISAHTKVFLLENRFIITKENCKMNGYESSVCGFLDLGN
eukprot:252552_1